MMKHPKLSSVCLGSVDIPNYSSSKCLFKYAKSINNYIEVQSINQRKYTAKEIAFMYLSHLDDEAYMNAKTRLNSQLHFTPTPIPVHLCVPGIAVTLSQMSSDKSIDSSYINKTTEF